MPENERLRDVTKPWKKEAIIFWTTLGWVQEYQAIGFGITLVSLFTFTINQHFPQQHHILIAAMVHDTTKLGRSGFQYELQDFHSGKG